MEEKLFSEIRSLYVSDKKKPVDIRIRIRMRDLIDPEALHHAVETTMKRYPYFCVELQKKDGEYVFAENDQIVAIEDDIKLKQIELAESQRDLDKCIVKAREDGVITYVSDAIANGVVVKGKDILTEASGDVGFYTEVKNTDYEFEVGAVYKAQSPTMEFDVVITEIEENTTGSKTLHFKPVSDDVVYVSTEKFEVVIPLEKMRDVVYVEERLVYTAVNEKRFVYLVDENGFRDPTYVEVDSVVDGMAIISSGLEGGEEVAAK